ncbi:metallophosphoesterase [Planctomonas psychrotolerans]|uniref:metallophosphoesterase n=1 Tax=Planctomonas psychrotolerans TaxID=2528712 RepID=UPI001D0CF574|nr:metallophosphoesterase [Planctomonas psychrotolerans]
MSRAASIARVGGTVLGSITALGAVSGSLAFAYGALVERNRFTVRRVTMPVLPAGSEPIRVLHISDMHMAPWQKRKQEWIRSLADLRPDLIVDTGDNTGHARGIEGVERALEPFAGVAGVFVHGSNDYYGPVAKNPLRYFRAPTHRTERAPDLDIARLESLFARYGWLDLNNAVGALELKGTHLEFFGVNDAHRDFDRPERIPRALDDLRENDELYDALPENDEERSVVTIGVTHAPYQRVLNSFVTHGAIAIFAGHTHGGQVCVPGYGALVTNCDIPRRQVSGLSIWTHALSAAYLNVSAGLGTSIYAPVRFACRPEATLVTLTALS